MSCLRAKVALRADLVADARNFGDQLFHPARIRRPDRGDLLRTLIALAEAHTEPAVIAAYARGCRYACFELEVPALEDVHEGARRVPALAAQIAERARELETAADNQEAVDAHGNASAYRRAAEAIARAAKLLA